MKKSLQVFKGHFVNKHIFCALLMVGSFIAASGCTSPTSIVSEGRFANASPLTVSAKRALDGFEPVSSDDAEQSIGCSSVFRGLRECRRNQFFAVSGGGRTTDENEKSILDSLLGNPCNRFLMQHEVGKQVTLGGVTFQRVPSQGVQLARFLVTANTNGNNS